MNRILGNAKQIAMHYIHNDILNNIRKVCEKCVHTQSISSRLHQQYLSYCKTLIESAPKKDLEQSPTNSKTMNSFPSKSSPALLVPKTAEMIIDLWTNCLVFKETFDKYRDELNVSDSCEYFFNSSTLDRLCKASNIPNFEDSLRIRMETKGVDTRKVYYSETEGFPKLQQLAMDEKFLKQYPNCISVLDFGGNCRKKWKGYFHNITLCVYLVNLSSFNKKSKENPEKNELVDSLELFEEMVNHESFNNIPILLLFNKVERFSSLIESGNDLCKIFPEHENRGKSATERIESSLSFLKLKFESKAWSRKDYLHCRFVSLLNNQDSNQLLMEMLTLSKLLKEDFVSDNIDKKKNCLIM